MPTNLEIAQEAKLLPIMEVAARLSLTTHLLRRVAIINTSDYL